MNKTKIPLKISLNKNSELLIVWNDDSVNEIKLKLLRDECPCAGCKGETILGKVHLPISLPTYKPGTVSYTHLRAHETVLDLVCRLLLEKKQI